VLESSHVTFVLVVELLVTFAFFEDMACNIVSVMYKEGKRGGEWLVAKKPVDTAVQVTQTEGHRSKHTCPRSTHK